MEETSPTQWGEDGRLEVLTFDLQTEKFAIEAVLVREILDLLPETVVPGADRLVASVANFRGKIIPIADLRLAFGLPSAESTIDNRIVVVELDVDGVQTQIGIRTDKVHEVTTLHRDASETPPTVGLRWRRDYIRELVRTPHGVIVLANIARIFDPLLSGRGAPAVLAPAIL